MRVYEFAWLPAARDWRYKDPASGKWVVVKGRGKSTLSETVGGEERREEFPTTLYSLNWLPIGGFCKIKGESGEDGAAPDSFAYHRPGKRPVVLVAGVAMNILLAAALLSLGFMIGLPTAISAGVDPKAVTLEPVRTVVQQVLADSPAEFRIKAGTESALMRNRRHAPVPEKLKHQESSSTSFRLSGTASCFHTVLSIMPGGDDIPRLAFTSLTWRSFAIRVPGNSERISAAGTVINIFVVFISSLNLLATA